MREASGELAHGLPPLGYSIAGVGLLSRSRYWLSTNARSDCRRWKRKLAGVGGTGCFPLALADDEADAVGGEEGEAEVVLKVELGPAAKGSFIPALTWAWMPGGGGLRLWTLPSTTCAS